MLVVSKGRWGLATKLASDRSLDNDKNKTFAGRQHLDNSSRTKVPVPFLMFRIYE
jgi:hypothetical protein